ncbi:MAG TPA: cupin domain-containing protein [Actinomycetota bacterium]|nr:cupin domain-containing protein [Actinomycetota bacterium]
MGREQEAVRIGRGELVEIESPPEIRRQQAFAKPGLWAGIATTQPGLVSGWHHHGDHDTIVYVLSGRLAIEFGEGGRQAVQVAAGDFLVIPSGLVHREGTPTGDASESVVIRAGGDGPPTIEVDGPSP